MKKHDSTWIYLFKKKIRKILDINIKIWSNWFDYMLGLFEIGRSVSTKNNWMKTRACVT